MTSNMAQPHLFVVLGGKGDLTHRKLLPALYRLRLAGFISDRCLVVGAAREATDDQSFRAWAREGLIAAGFDMDDAAERWIERCLFYQSIGGENGYERLQSRLERLEIEHDLPGNRIFYLSMPPGAFPIAISALGELGMNRSRGWVRLVIEKPFGHDLASARELNDLVHQYFLESQIYRIDHYLGKETVQNLLVFRFANPLFENMWNRDRVERVEITVAESLGVEGRAGYYDKSGALRDMIQNHLTQLLTLTAMEVPGTFEAEAIRDEKVKVLKSIRLNPDDVVYGQYTAGEMSGKPVPDYLDEPGVAENSRTETYAALRLEVNNWRWQGVPFLLRTGKRMPRRSSKIVVTFRRPPVGLFNKMGAQPVEPNKLIITLQPEEGFDLTFGVKEPGGGFKIQTQRLRFRYSETHQSLPDAYETLLLDVMNGDATLFVRADEVEAAWQLYSPLLTGDIPVYGYEAGSWGPEEADRLVGEKGESWTTL